MSQPNDNLELSRLQELVGIVSPTMNEGLMTDTLRALLSLLGAEVAVDHMGNIAAYMDRGADRTVALSAHTDTIAVQITNILPNGFLQFRPIGPLPHTLLGQRVSILNFRGEIVNGVIGFDPTSQYGQPKGLVYDDLWIDICAAGKEQAGRQVRVGDLAVFAPQCFSLGEGMIGGAALDNRVGLFIVTEIGRSFAAIDCNVNLEILLTTQEEVGLRGAQVINGISKADQCIVVDVEYATDTLTPHNSQLSEVALGGGPALLHKADNNRAMLNRIAETAELYDIPLQHAVGRYPYGGTDATQLQVGCGGRPVANIGIPLRYMHSPVEICAISDIRNAISLITRYISQI